jgi:hypothetical protein
MHPLQPRHAVEGLGDEDDDVLRTALALWERALQIGDPSATQERSRELPAVTDAAQVPLELATVEL